MSSGSASVPKCKPPIPPKPKIFLKEPTQLQKISDGAPNGTSSTLVGRRASAACHHDASGTSGEKCPTIQGGPDTLHMASNGNSEPRQQQNESAVNRGRRNVSEKGNTITENWSLKESLESGDEACCTRISYLFQRKAKEFSSHLTRPSKLRGARHSDTTGSLPKQPLSFGDEISANSIRFADEDISEVSSDYQDLDLSRVASEATAASVHHVTRTKVTSSLHPEGEAIELVEPSPEDLTTPAIQSPADVAKETVQNAAAKDGPKRPPPPRPPAPNDCEIRGPLINMPTKDVKQSHVQKKPLRPPPPTHSKSLITRDKALESTCSKVQEQDGHPSNDVSAGEISGSFLYMRECLSSTNDVKADCKKIDSDGVTSPSSVSREPEKLTPKKKRTPPPRPPPPKLATSQVSAAQSVSAIDDCCQTDDLTDFRTKNVIEDLDKLLLMQDKAHEGVACVEHSLDMLVKETAHKFFPEVSTEVVEGHPEPPPRLKRRARSRTVEAVRARVCLPRRSHSLSEADVRKKKAYRDALQAENVAATLTETFVMVVESPLSPQELHSLCTNVVTEDCKSSKEFKEPRYPSPSQIRFRPLPAPPPPPRGRTRTYHRSNNNEVSAPTKHMLQEAKNQKPVTKLDKSPGDKKFAMEQEPQAPRRTDTIDALDSTIDTAHLEEKQSSGRNSLPLLHEKRVSSSTFYDCLDTPPEGQQGAESPLDGMGEKSQSSWYDDSDASGDVADVDSPIHPSDSDRPLSSSPSSTQRSRPKGAKEKKRPSSKFYCDVEDRESSTDREVDRPACPRRTKDKEDQADDTDELLEMAQGLQEEMHQVLVERQKRLLQTLESELSGQQVPVTDPKEETEELPRGKEEESTGGGEPQALATPSEVSWQHSSDDESETEDSTSHLSSGEASLLRNKRKLFYIAREMATSENVFVDALRLLNVDFRSAVHKASIQKGYPVIPEEVLEQVLKHLPQLQALNERLLTDLCDRVKHWEDRSRIADILVKIGPFLKLYSSYIMDFESMTIALEEAKRKYPDFAIVAHEFQQSPRCKQLTIEQYMLKPIQRIPQYRLLLQDYVNHLRVDAEDYRNACNALEIVSQVANHANESMKLGDNFSQLISLQNRIQGHFEVIKPGRIIIREGELMKASRKIMQPRWFVLFSDSLLYLTPVQQGYYKVNYELPLSGMKVMVRQQPDYKNEFSIITTRRSFILCASSPEERELWIAALNKAIEDTVTRRCTFLLLQKDGSEDSSNSELGKEAPVWIPDRRVTMCQLCTREFTFTHRRHHCRACGKVVCSACSSNRIALHYVGPKPVRVCDQCYYSLRLTTSCGHTETSFDIRNEGTLQLQEHTIVKKRNVKGILQEVAANDQGSLLSGYLHQWWKGAWKRRWFVIKDHVLYVYRASEDICASRTVPLLGYQVQPVHKGFEEIPREHLFELAHSGINSLIFYADSPSLADQWRKAMEQATTLS